MVRKLALTSLFFNNGSETASVVSRSMSSTAASFSTAASWQWRPSCTQAKTHSFRAGCDASGAPEIVSMRHGEHEEEYRTTSIMNPAYDLLLDDGHLSSVSSSYEIESRRLYSTVPPEPAAGEVAVTADADEEAILHGIRSTTGRLFFEPEPTSSIVKTKTPPTAEAFDGATALAIESADPYGDFRRSMEEMVASHGGGAIGDWRWLEEMLGWYLTANGKKTHGLIVGAFVDLLVALTAGDSDPSPAAVDSNKAGLYPLPVSKAKHQIDC